MKLDDLPPRIRKKIDPISTPGCWIWTGAVTPARQRVRPYHHSNSPDEHQRNYSHFKAAEKAVPLCYDPSVGYAVPAHRYVFGLALGVGTQQVPRLGRCVNERCVNPQHCLPTEGDDQTLRRKKSRLKCVDVPLNPQTTSPEDILTRLKAARPAPYLSPESAAEEANCPVPDAVTWAAYVAWDAVEPEEVE